MFFESDNHVSLKGNLAREVNPNYTQKGTAVASVTLYAPIPAVDENGAQKATPLTCVFWDKAAENLAKVTAKGSPLEVVGYLQMQVHTDKENKKYYQTVVNVSSFKVLETKKETETRRKKVKENENQ